MMDKWDLRMIGIAEDVSSWSKDPNGGVGAIVVSPDRRQVSWGFNGLPRGIEDKPAVLNNRELKNRLTVHAELNALLNGPGDVTGWTMYTTFFPCCSKNCTQSIIQKGLVRVVSPAIAPSSNWHADQQEAHDLLLMAGIVVTTYNREVLPT